MSGVTLPKILLENGKIFVTEVRNESYESAKKTLENIQEIFRNHQQYFDALKKTTPKELSSMVDRISDTFSKRSYLSVPKQQAMGNLCKKIEENMKKFISSSPEKELEKPVNLFSILPFELMENVMEFLGVSNLRSLKLVNKTAKKDVEKFSKSFFQKVLSQLEKFLERYPEVSLTEKELEGIISLKTKQSKVPDGELEKLIFTKTEQDKITDEEISGKLKALNALINIDHLLMYFSSEGIYDSSFEELKLFLSKREAWKNQYQKLDAALERSLKQLAEMQGRLDESDIIKKIEIQNLKKRIAVLIEKGADASNVLIAAVGTQNKFMIVALLECGIDIDASYGVECDDGFIHKRNLLMMAVAKGDLEICKLLLERGAKIENKDEQEITALMIAVEMGNQAIYELLLEEGANLEAVDKEGWTPLWYAVKNGDVEVAKFLLGKPYKANLNAKDFRSKTLLEVLENNDYDWRDEQVLFMREFLLAYNPDLDDVVA